MLSSRRNRVETTSSTQQNTKARRYSSSSLPELITYDVFEEKSVQQLLYEAAEAQKKAKHKWEIFIDKLGSYITLEILGSYITPEKLSKQLVKTLDDKNQWAPLHYAVFNDNTYVVDKLTGKNSKEKQFQCDVNILTGNGENVLHIAAQSSYIWEKSSSHNTNLLSIAIKNGEKRVELPEIIFDLIKRGADVNHADDEHRTPLHLAVMHNRLAFVKYLLEKKANIYAVTKLYDNVLHLSFIPSGQTSDELTDMFNYLKKELESPRSTRNFRPMEKSRDFARAFTLDNRTPIVLAVCHPKITEDVIEKLVIMMQIHPKDIVIHFLVNESLAESNAIQTQMLVAMEQVSRCTFQDYNHLGPIIRFCNLRKLKIRYQFFHFACRYNNLSLLKWLIGEVSLSNNEVANSKKMLNENDHAGYTPLLTAVFYEAINCVEYLLQDSRSSARSNTARYFEPADIEATNDNGDNILHIYAKHPVSEHLLELIWQPAVERDLLNKLDDDGNLPLHAAAGNNQIEFCKKALDACKDPNDFLYIKNNHGQTAAHVATVAVHHRIGPERHYAERHHFYESKGQNRKTDAEEKDDDDDEDHDFGLPVLRLIWDNAKKGDKTSSLFKRDNNEQTCLHLAAAKGQKQIVKFLVEEVGIEIDSAAYRRLTPLHLACQYGHNEVVAYLIENGASPTLRNAELYNCLEIAIMNQHEKVVKKLLTLPNWRQLMRNAQKIPHTEAYDTPMRKLIRYMPQVTIWLIDQHLTRKLGGPGKHVFKTVYDYEFYTDIYLVRKWYTQGANISEEVETCKELWNQRGCDAIYTCRCCCQLPASKRDDDILAYTDDAYTLVRNHPLLIAGQESQVPELIEHPYNTSLRDQLFSQYGFYAVRFISFIVYAFFLGVFTAIVLSGKHPEYFYAKVNRTMTLDLTSCAIVSNNLTTANDTEALKTDAYINMKWGLYTLFIVYIVKNVILILALFPKVFRTLEYYLEISALVLSFVYVLDWYSWQSPVIFRCPIQYQLGAMGLLLAYINLLSYVRRVPWFKIGVFVTMLQLIFFKFINFIPVLLVIILGFGFTNWMLLQNQTVFENPMDALMRTWILTFELQYEDHLYDDVIYYELIFVIMILASIVFCIFILNLLISLAIDIPSLNEQATSWRSQMLYNLLSDYWIIFFQIMRLLSCLRCSKFQKGIKSRLVRDGTRLQPIVIIERDETGTFWEKAWRHVDKNFFKEEIQDDIILNNKSVDHKKDDEI